MSPLAGIGLHLPALQVVVPLLAAPACMLVRDPRRTWWLARSTSAFTSSTRYSMPQGAAQPPMA